MKTKNNKELNINELFEFKKKFRSVIGDLMLEKFELKNPLLLRIGKW